MAEGKIEEQKSMGLLSVFTNTEASEDELVLIHSMDQLLTGSSVSPGAVHTVVEISFTDNDIEIPDGVPDDFVRRDHSYGLPSIHSGLPGLHKTQVST